MLQNVTVDEVTVVALELQGKWRDGELSRFKVLEQFVERMVTDDESEEITWLGKINVVTSKFFLIPVSTTPRDIPHLRELLIKSAWIPFGTGLGFFAELPTLKGAVSSALPALAAGNVASAPAPATRVPRTSKENDGGFSLLFHPRCSDYVFLPATWKMLSNFLNVNMGMDVEKELYN